MRAFDRNGQLCGRLAHARDDPVDGASDHPSIDRALLWSLSGPTNHGRSDRSTVPSSPPVFSPIVTDLYQHTSDGTVWSPKIQRERKLLLSLKDHPCGISKRHDTKDAGAMDYSRLKADNAELAQALLEMEKELKTTKQATRDLAAWTLNERNRLMTEALHQRLLREDYEVILRQRDEQVVYLLALHQEGKPGHARTLVHEGDVMGRSVSAKDLMKMNEMRAQVGLPPIDEHGATVMPQRKDGRTADASAEAQGVLGRCDREEGEVIEDEEGSYSPPDADIPVSIIDQVDELIAEEKGKLVSRKEP